MTTANDPIPEHLENLRHAFPAVRLRAIKALGKLGPNAIHALPGLSAVVNDNDAKVREAAAQAIGAVGPAALPVLAKNLTHRDKYVRRNTVWALAKLGPAGRSVLPDLCHALRDSDPRTAAGAAQAIGEMGSEAASAVPSLAEAMRGTNIVLCRLAAKALSQVGRPALTTLVAHLKHHDPFVRGEAAVALGWMGPLAAPAVQSLIDVLRTTKPASRTMRPVAATGTPLTAAITPKPGETPPEDATRASTVQALGRIGPDAMTALSYLQDALADESDTVRRAAELSIRQVQGH